MGLGDKAAPSLFIFNSSTERGFFLLESSTNSATEVWRIIRELGQGLEDERCLFFKGADDMSRQLVPELMLFPKLML